MKNKNNEHRIVSRVQKMTFPEAASLAYHNRVKLGTEWEIISISKEENK